MKPENTFFEDHVTSYKQKLKNFNRIWDELGLTVGSILYLCCTNTDMCYTSTLILKVVILYLLTSPNFEFLVIMFFLTK